jgi:hypothetical protein
MLERDRKRWGLTVGLAAWRFGVSAAEYRELEAGTRSPSFEAYDRICELFGSPQAFARRIVSAGERPGLRTSSRSRCSSLGTFGGREGECGVCRLLTIRVRSF